MKFEVLTISDLRKKLLSSKIELIEEKIDINSFDCFLLIKKDQDIIDIFIEDAIFKNNQNIAIIVDSNINIKCLNFFKNDQNNRFVFFVFENSIVNLNYIELNKRDLSSNTSIDIFLSNDSSMKTFLLVSGAKKNIINCKSYVGNYCSSNIDSVLYLKNEESVSLNIENYFIGSNSNGEIRIKSVLKNKARAEIEGVINISKDGSKTNAYLKEDIILLDNACFLKAIPSLYIDNNDVKASHGVTVSEISNETMFYFESRGINKNQAKDIITYGFLNESIDKFNISPSIVKKFFAN